MSGTQLLRLLVNERLTAAAEEIFGLVEKTIAEYQDEAVRSKREIIQLRQQIEQLTVLKPKETAFRADTQLVSEELSPTLQQCDIKVEKVTVLEETEIQEHPQVKEEQIDQSISPDMEADTSNDAEVRHPISEPATNCELLPSFTTETVSENESIDDEWDESDGSSSPRQSQSAEVVVELEQPLREEKSCRFCGKIFKTDTDLIRHVAQIHKGCKVFKCFECDKEFTFRHTLVEHMRIHTGEKPFSCDYCDKTFTQRSTCVAHMRVHTGEKRYICNKCGKGFATRRHSRSCKMQNECKTPPENVNVDEGSKEENTFKCFQCKKEFKQKCQLDQHMRVHTGEKPFSCDYCCQTFTRNSSRKFHMRQHTGENQYFCKKCGERCTRGKQGKHCRGTQSESTNNSFSSMTFGETFHTDLDLKVHNGDSQVMEMILQGQEMEEKKN